MKEELGDRLGEPSLRLAGFQLWVHGREFPDAVDAWDGNWLRVSAHCGASGGSVWATGTLLDTVGLLRFHDGLVTLYRTLRGEAVLESAEPNLRVRLDVADRALHLRMQVEITPEHLTQRHWFEFGLDQTHLPPVIARCAALLAAFPVRDPKGRGF